MRQRTLSSELSPAIADTLDVLLMGLQMDSQQKADTGSSDLHAARSKPGIRNTSAAEAVKRHLACPTTPINPSAYLSVR